MAKKEVIKIPLYDNVPEDKKERLQAFYEKWYKCKRCLLGTFRESDDIVFGEGNPNAKCMIIGEAPGEQEEKVKIPFVGPSGQLLNQLLADASSDPSIRALSEWYSKVTHTKENENTFHEHIFKWRHEEFFLTNVVSCRPPENRVPTPKEIEACWERLYNLIYAIDPLLIITVGKTPLEALLRKKIEITKVRGQVFDCTIPGRVGVVTYPVYAMLHPSYLLRKADWKIADGDFSKTVIDFRKAFVLLEHIKAQLS